MPSRDDLLAERHATAQRRLQFRVALGIRALVLALDDASDESMQAYADAHAVQVAAGQYAAVRVASIYLAHLWGPSDPVEPEAALGDVLVTPRTPSASSPILRLRHRLAEGDDWSVALDTSAGYAELLADADLQAAQRRGLDAGADVRGHRVYWRKVLGPDACDWCRKVADRGYRRADTVAFHAGDHCGVAPIIE